MVTNQAQEEVGGGINRLYRAGASAEAEELAELGDEDLNQPQVVQHTDHCVEKYQRRHQLKTTVRKMKMKHTPKLYEATSHSQKQ